MLVKSRISIPTSDPYNFQVPNTVMKTSIFNLVRPRRQVRDTPKLIPPIQLYRNILRAHSRKLTPELRAFGDEYVKAEFHMHKCIDNPLQIVAFLAQWQDYLSTIDNGSWRTGRLLASDLEKMLPEQVGQLYELMKETKHVQWTLNDQE